MAEIANNSIDIQVVETGGENAQYFWHNTTDSGAGEGAGAHVTQIPKADFVADPENGGGNTLITSNGMFIRNGIDELATFSDSIMRIGEATSSRTEITPSGFSVISQEGIIALDVGKSSTSELQWVEVYSNSDTVTEAFCSSVIGAQRTVDISHVLANLTNGTEIKVTLKNFRNSRTYSGGAIIETSSILEEGTGNDDTIIIGTAKTTSYHILYFNSSTSASSRVGAYYRIVYDGNSTLYVEYQGTVSAGPYKPSYVANGTRWWNTVKLSVLSQVTATVPETSLNGYVTFNAPSKVFAVETVEIPTTSISGNTAAEFDMTVNKSGYYPIGVVGFSIIQGSLVARRMYIDTQAVGSCRAVANVRNTSSSSAGASRVNLNILWVKAE